MEDLQYKHICWAKMNARFRILSLSCSSCCVFFLCLLFYDHVIDLFVLPLDLDLRCAGVALTHHQCPRVRGKDSNAT